MGIQEPSWVPYFSAGQAKPDVNSSRISEPRVVPKSKRRCRRSTLPWASTTMWPTPACRSGLRSTHKIPKWPRRLKSDERFSSRKKPLAMVIFSRSVQYLEKKVEETNSKETCLNYRNVLISLIYELLMSCKWILLNCVLIIEKT